MQVDSDDAMLSRSNSLQPVDEGENGAVGRRGMARRDKGKGKERTSAVRVKEEPSTVSLNANDSAHPAATNATVSGLIILFTLPDPLSSPTRTIVRHVARSGRSYTVTGARELSTLYAWTPQWNQQIFQQVMLGGSAQLVCSNRCVRTCTAPQQRSQP